MLTQKPKNCQRRPGTAGTHGSTVWFSCAKVYTTSAAAPYVLIDTRTEWRQAVAPTDETVDDHRLHRRVTIPAEFDTADIRQWWTVAIGHRNVTDAAITALANGCPALRHVDLQNCYNLTDAAKIIPGSMTKRNGFQTFCVEADGASVNLCDAVILALANGCPGLTNINVSSCGVLTDAAIIALANGCPGLTNVNLTSCKNVTDATIIALVNGCPGLSDLDLTSCINVTDAAIVALANRCPRVHCTQWDKNPNAIKEHF